MNFFYSWYVQFITSLGLPKLLAMITFPILPFVIIAVVLILIVLFLVFAERKILAFFTQRKGPNRVGYNGILQTVADALKLLCKENIDVEGVDKILFNLAPILAFTPVLIVYGLIPYSSEFEFMNFSVSALLFLAILAMPALAIILAGYSSNNKFSLIGSMRAVTQIISFEIPIIFVLLSVVILTSTINLNEIIMSQISSYPFCGWLIFPCFLGFLIMFICTLAELNRCPFDLPEAESELVAGYNVEYSGMRFALFFLAEYALLFINSMFLVVLFFGGYLSPLGFYISEKIFQSQDICNFCIYFEQVFWIFIKSFILTFIIIWVRATLPRLNASKLLSFSWFALLPAAILNFILICLYKYMINFRGVM